MSRLYRTIIWGDVSLAVADTTDLVNEAIERHRLSPVAAAALGRTLTATAYLCGWLKETGSSLSVTFDGNGAGGKVVAAGDGNLFLRGYCERPDANLPLRTDGKLDVGGFVGKEGVLTVIRDDGEGLPFVGTCALSTGEIAEDFVKYFAESEQRPSAIALGVQIDRDGRCSGAGGVFLQPFPGAKDESIARAEEMIARCNRVSSLIRERGAEGILQEFGAREWDSREIFWHCRCSRKNAARALSALGRTDAEKLIEEQGKVTVHCHYCNTDYSFFQDDLDGIFQNEARNERQ